MKDVPTWWQKPRRISVVIDNDEWMLPHCETLVAVLRDTGDDALLFREYEKIKRSDVTFFLSCHNIVSTEILSRSQRNLVIHASALPTGRGMSPLTWQVLEGLDKFPVCLLEVAEQVDAGEIIYQEFLNFNGHELIDEMREALAELTIQFCKRFLGEENPPVGTAQVGEASYYPRRSPSDSVINPEKPISQQFNLFRVVDNERYPAFFDWQGHRYRLRIDKIGCSEDREPES